MTEEQKEYKRNELQKWRKNNIEKTRIHNKKSSKRYRDSHPERKYGNIVRELRELREFKKQILAVAS